MELGIMNNELWKCDRGYISLSFEQRQINDELRIRQDEFSLFDFAVNIAY